MSVSNRKGARLGTASFVQGNLLMKTLTEFRKMHSTTFGDPRYNGERGGANIIIVY